MKTDIGAVKPYPTKDGSEIRELMHPAVHGASHGAALQSLAEARVMPGETTQAHFHRRTEELYHFTAGSGRMHLGDAVFEVAAGDTVCIPPGVAHHLVNTGMEPMRLLCACTPPYSHEDTILVDA
jgi:mannose-6-phosphate isomerase-like protein (cupin superfamily)